MVEGVEASYCRLLEIVKKPTQENWYERYSSGLRLDRVEQGRRLVAVTPVLPAAWSNPDWTSNVRSIES